MHYLDLPTEIRLLILTLYFNEEAQTFRLCLPRMVSRQFDNDLFAVLTSSDIGRFTNMYTLPGKDRSWLRCILNFHLQTHQEWTPIVKHLRAVGSCYIDHCRAYGADICSEDVWHHLTILYTQKMAWINETSFYGILQWSNIQSDMRRIRLDALALAAFVGHLEVFTDIELKHWSQESLLGPPIVAAAIGQQFETVKSIVPFGIHAASHVAPLIVAAWHGDIELVRFLLQYGADVSEVHQGRHTALQATCRKGHKECAELLIQGGADIDQKPVAGTTALNTAAKFRHPLLVALLLKAGGNVNGVDRRPPITSAADAGDENSLRVLLENGADVNAEFPKWGTALTCLATRGWRRTSDRGIGMAQLLLNYGADLHFGDSAPPPLQAAARSGNNALVEFLLDSGARIDQEGLMFDSALSFAVNASKFDTVKLLLDRGADVNAHRKNHPTALVFAVHRLSPSEKMVNLLLDTGADLSINHSALGAPLGAAACCGHEHLVRLLLERGADVRACDRNGETALYKAARSGRDPVVKILIEAGADVNAEGGRYRCCLRAAAYLGHRSTMELLLSAGADANRLISDGFDASSMGLTQDTIARAEQLIQSCLSRPSESP